MKDYSYERRHHCLQTYYLLSGKTDRKGRTIEFESGPNSDEYRRLAGAQYKKLGIPMPATPPAGKTWKGIYYDAHRQATLAEAEAKTCPRCRKEPVSKPDSLCVHCRYAELGEKMFVMQIEFKGVVIKIDGEGRAHIQEYREGRFWPVLPDVKWAKRLINKKQSR